MKRETRDALQEVLTQLSSLMSGLTQMVAHADLCKAAQSFERAFRALNEETIDPE